MSTHSTDVVLLAASSSATSEYISIFWITAAALLAPLASALVKKKIPDVVFLIIFGVLIGPQVLGLASTDGGVALVKDLGLGLLFLLAGYEINAGALRGRQGAFAVGSWLVSFTLGLVLAVSLSQFSGSFSTYAVIGIALSSTAWAPCCPCSKATVKRARKSATG
ncbi:cation:proton antiporter [Rothia nasimurium]|uniref:cation:proton antiporter domain-containing protein n=1 Tax=Rothia nasimurium TaxID=85336 RepID=UPI002240FF1F|nr:cation:proton antiporter [Rothia nasimurium]